MIERLLFVSGLSALASWILSFGTRRLSHVFSADDLPLGGRKIHRVAIPQLGGLGIGVVLIAALIFLTSVGWLNPKDVRPEQLVGFGLGIFILLLGGALDDRFRLSPWRSALFAVLAAGVVVVSGTTISAVTRPDGLGALSLVWWKGNLSLGLLQWHWSWPSDILSFFWILLVTGATKFEDGLDGLVTGQTTIGAGIILALTMSLAYFQPSVALLAAAIGGAFVGFLPWNFSPARQFLGESGATLAGFSLAFLAIVSGAKVATALMIVGLPLIDILLVMSRRIWRGQSPFVGDDSHLHFRLLQSGLSQRQTVGLLWIISLIFGAGALLLQSRGKIVLLLALVGLAILLSFITSIIAAGKKFNRRIVLGLFVVALLFVLAGAFVTRMNQPIKHKPVAATRSLVNLEINGRSFELELARTQAEKELGLGSRASLPANRGMLFIYAEPAVYSFWMYRMNFPLDIIWFDENRVVDIASNLPSPRWKLDPPAIHTPQVKADRVLELNAGEAEKLGLRVGSEVQRIGEIE